MISDNKNAVLLASGAIAAAGIISSYYLYNKVQELEEEIRMTPRASISDIKMKRNTT